jgi:hypothetical protein
MLVRNIMQKKTDYLIIVVLKVMHTLILKAKLLIYVKR